jgi:hypothetical protein
MKYLKTFEQNKFLYKIDDYVLFFNPDTKSNLPGQIIDIQEESEWPYRIYYFEEDILGFLSENEIIRKLTPEEIEIFEIRKITNKYNI